MYRFKLSIILLTSTILIFSCGGNSQKKSSETTSEYDEARKKIAKDISNVLNDLPSPSEVPYLLMNTGAEYNADIINSLDKMNAYQVNEAKATLNLGVYATDIGYLASYGKSELALDYMGECQKLAAPVGVAEAIDYSMISKFEANMENRDSLTAIINEVMEKSGKRLSELNELNSVALLLAGSWIEGLYISTTIINTYPDNLPKEAKILVLSPLVKIIMNQKTSLNDLLKIMNDVPQSESVNGINESLKKIKVFYDGELAEVEKQISENTGNFILTPGTLDNLSKEVKRIRAAIVE